MGRLLSSTVGILMLLPGIARADLPMNYLHTFGPAADPITALGWGLLSVSVLVVLVVTVLLVGAMFRGRSQPSRDADGRLEVGYDRGGLRWIYIGVGVSTVVLFACAIWTFATLAAVTEPATEPELTVEVTGHQWWWQVRYLGDDPRESFTTANEIHIPVGQPVEVHLKTADVIHSFWVPRLAGKTDLIPGVTNTTWLQADEPGVYRGQCAEYCGLQHAHMALQVVAEAPEAFAAWRSHQRAQAQPPETKIARQGQAVFRRHCSVCHVVRGSGGALGIVGPDLTHVMSRRRLAAGMLKNDTAHLAAWIVNAQAFKPGALMPTLMLSGRELGDVVAYMKTLD